MADKLILGFDVSKDWIDVARRRGGDASVVRIANDASAIAGFLAGEAGIALAAFEPTGGCERVLRRELAEAGIAFARIHPNEIAAFRTRRGVEAELVLGLAGGKTRGTDRIDARLIADFAALELDGRGLKPMVEGDETLREMTIRRAQLVAMLHADDAGPRRSRAPPSGAACRR